MPDSISKARQVKLQYESEWMELEGVVAVGIGLIENNTGIIISVKSTPESIRQLIPAEIDGVPIRVEESGEISAQ